MINNTELKSIKLFKLFSQLQHKKFVFAEPGGNAGDHLIYAGAYKLAQSAGIKFTHVDYTTFMKQSIPSDTVIYIHGAGGFNPFCSGKAFEGPDFRRAPCYI